MFAYSYSFNLFLSNSFFLFLNFDFSFLLSQAIIADKTVYVSGCIGLVPETMKLASDSVEGQVRQALTNLQQIVEASGASLTSVVKCTLLLADMADFQLVNKIYKEFFNSDMPPARACFAVKDLPAGAKFEIDAVAILN